jgi:phosphatidylserine decarboxylase
MEEKIFAFTSIIFILLLLLVIFNFSPVILSVLISFTLIFGWLLLMLFFIFEREPVLFPVQGDFIISPAAGRVMQICQEGDFDCVKIFMDLQNIHTQIVPYDGKVTEIKSFKGGHERAYLPEAEHNAGVETTFETRLGTMKIKQLTGILVRRIKVYSRMGQEIKRGEKFGKVTFGSNVFLYLPKGKTKILVEVNQDLMVGATKVAVPIT